MLKPIDMQQVIVQIDHVEKVQQTQQQHPDRQQKYMDLQLREERRLLKSKVKDSEETDKVQIKDEKKDRERDNQASSGHHEKPRRLFDVEDQDVAEQGILIDIKV